MNSVRRFSCPNKETCLTYCVKVIKNSLGRCSFQLRLFAGVSHDALALHLYLYLPDENKTYSFVPKRVAHNPSFFWSLKRVLRFFFPFRGDVIIADGDYYSPKLFHDFHCISIPLFKRSVNG